MGKKSRQRNRTDAATVRGPGEPSGRASPARAGRVGATRPATAARPARRRAFVARPFEGLPGECDLVAMREFVPAATAPLTPSSDGRPRPCSSATLLPMAAPALVREDGADLARAAGAARVRRPEPRPGRRAAPGPATPSPAAWSA